MFFLFFFFGVILRFCFPEKKIGLEFSGTTRLPPLFPLVSDTVDRRWGVLDFDRVTSEYRRYSANSFYLFFFFLSLGSFILFASEKNFLFSLRVERRRTSLSFLII